MRWEVPRHEKQLISRDASHRFFMPPSQRRTALMARRRVWNIDAGISFCCAANSEIHILEIRLECFVEPAHHAQQLGAKNSGRKRGKTDDALAVPGRTVGTGRAAAPRASTSADGIPSAVEM